MVDSTSAPQIQTVFQRLSGYFSSSPISSIFFTFLFVVFVLNICKWILTWWEKRKGCQNQSCKFLFSGNLGPICQLPSREQGFIDRKNSCEGCTGKTFSISNEEIVARIAASATWKRILILLANCSKTVLPYVSFLYTLSIAIFEKKS